MPRARTARRALDHGQTQGATSSSVTTTVSTSVERSLSRGRVEAFSGGDEQQAAIGHALGEATGSKEGKRSRNDVSGRDIVVLGSGNLGLIYLMEADRRLTLEEIEDRHPDLIGALRAHAHIGWLLVRSAEQGPLVLGPSGSHRLTDGHVVGDDPLAPFADRVRTPVAHRRLRPRRRHHGRQLL